MKPPIQEENKFTFKTGGIVNEPTATSRTLFVFWKVAIDWEGSEYNKGTDCVRRKPSQPQLEGKQGDKSVSRRRRKVRGVNQYEARQEEKLKGDGAKRQ